MSRLERQVSEGRASEGRAPEGRVTRVPIYKPQTPSSKFQRFAVRAPGSAARAASDSNEPILYALIVVRAFSGRAQNQCARTAASAAVATFLSEDVHTIRSLRRVR
jgi:hypothetical protein